MKIMLRELQNKFRGIKSIYTLLIILLILAPLVMQDPYILHVMVMTLAYITITVSWSVLSESGQFSLGHAAFFGVGAYTSALLYKNFLINPFLGMLFGALAACVFALVVGIICLRMHAFYLAIATLALAETIKVVVIMLPDITGGAVGVGISPLFGGDRVLNYYIALAITLAAVLTILGVRKSKLYLAFTSIRCDEYAASSVGINPLKYKLYAFVLSAVFTGFFGGFFSFYIGFIDPHAVFNIEISIAPQVMTIIGGLYTFSGPIIGAVIITLLDEFLRIKMPSGHLIVYGVILMLCVIFIPRGIIGAIRGRGRLA
jgi:branched-chain amino acid transport system permease protein